MVVLEGETDVVPLVADTVPTEDMEAEVAFVQECVSADALPVTMEVGLAVKDAVGSVGGSPAWR